MNIDKALDKAYEGKHFRELADAPVAALAGVTEADAKRLEEAFGIKTVRDLANNKYFKWARAIVIAADLEA
jgi:predicted RecB family nuclease